MHTSLTVAELISVLQTMPQDQQVPVDADSGFVTLDVQTIEPGEVAEQPSDVG